MENDMPALGAEGRKFESCLPDHISTTYTDVSPLIGEHTGNERDQSEPFEATSHGIVPDRFRNFTRQRDIIDSSATILADAIEQFSPTHIVSMVSGGKDSAASDQIARELGAKINFVMHGNTRCGIPETSEFVRSTYGALGDYVEADAGTAYLAHLAESMVALTSLKRRVSSDAETVGGAVDVALISKGDGFVWVKRKHYFRPELNPSFSQNYLRGL